MQPCACCTSKRSCKPTLRDSCKICLSIPVEFNGLRRDPSAGFNYLNTAIRFFAYTFMECKMILLEPCPSAHKPLGKDMSGSKCQEPPQAREGFGSASSLSFLLPIFTFIHFSYTLDSRRCEVVVHSWGSTLHL